jgi:hypothetical protein
MFGFFVQAIVTGQVGKHLILHPARWAQHLLGNQARNALLLSCL